MRYFWNFSFLLLVVLAGFSTSAASAGKIVSSAEVTEPPYWAGRKFRGLKDPDGNTLSVEFSSGGKSFKVAWTIFGEEYEGVTECSGEINRQGQLQFIPCDYNIASKVNHSTRMRGMIGGSVDRIEYTGTWPEAGPWYTGLYEKGAEVSSFSTPLTKTASRPVPPKPRKVTPVQLAQKNVEKGKKYYWAGRTFTELKDDNENSLTIKFSRDGRTYQVEWWRSGYEALEGRGKCGGQVYADGKLAPTADCMPLGVEQKAYAVTGYITGDVEKIELQGREGVNLGVIGPWVTGMAQERQKRIKEELLAKKIAGLIARDEQQNNQDSLRAPIRSSTQTDNKKVIWAGKRFENLADEYGNVLSVLFSDDGRSYEVKWAFFGEEHNGFIECGGKIEKNGNLRSTGECTPLHNQRQQGASKGEILGSVDQIEYTGSFPHAGPWNTGIRELKRKVAEEAQLLARLSTQLGINRISSQRDGGAKATPTGQGLDTETNKIVSQKPTEERKRLNAKRKRLAAEQLKLAADRNRAVEAAERAKLAAERQKLAVVRQKAEIDKLIAERERLAAEKLKLAADRKRALEKAEQARLSAESEKIAAEARRIVAERQLITEAAERKKLAEEQKRLSVALQELAKRQETLSTPTSQAPLRKGKRVALLIGNNDYETLPSLKNAVYDAESMAKKLNGLGWITILETNASRRKISRAMDRFSNQAMYADASLVFYAGHGIESQGVNYLVPSDSEVQEEADLRYEAIKTGDFLDLMASSRSATNILILDSCRNNPLEQGTRGRKRGLSMQQLPDSLGGTVIIYAAAPGSAAEDGPGGGNGIFTGALLDSLSMKDTSLSAVFSNTFSLVAQKTQNRQRPWKSSSLDERRFRF